MHVYASATQIRRRGATQHPRVHAHTAHRPAAHHATGLRRVRRHHIPRLFHQHAFLTDTDHHIVDSPICVACGGRPNRGTGGV